MTSENKNIKGEGSEFIFHPLAKIFLNKLFKKIQIINAFIKNMIQEKLTKLKRKTLHSSDNTLSEKNSTSY